MEENKRIQQNDKKEIEQQMLKIYESYQQSNGNPVTSISYYDQLILQSQQSLGMFGLQDVYPVGIDGTRKQEKNKIVLYQGGKEIAIIDDNSNIKFSEEYLMQMQEMSPQIYRLLQEINGQHFELPELQVDESLPDINTDGVGNFSLTKEELETKREENEKNLPEKDLEEQPEDEQLKDEQENEEYIVKIAKQSGITKDDIKSCSTIDPQEKITDAKTFENIANVTGRYTKIFVVASNGHSKDNSRFAFWGLTPDGQVEQIPELEERNGVNTGKPIYAINRDGTKVEEQQTAALFTLPNQREGFSVTIGQYGIVETTYIRRSPEENKFIGSAINSTTQRPTTREVKEFMNDSRTTDSEIAETIDKTEHQLDETEKTNIRNIDENPDNDVALDIDADIELHDGTITTLRKEAGLLNISPEEYARDFEEIEGVCPSDKIESIRLKHAPQDADVGEEGEERGERLTPEEQALQRRGLL